jgi:L,D-transpeptidase catalytic domain
MARWCQRGRTRHVPRGSTLAQRVAQRSRGLLVTVGNEAAGEAMRSDGSHVAITSLGVSVGTWENITNAVKGAATAALTTALVIAGGAGMAEAASATTTKPLSAPWPASAPPGPRAVSATPCGVRAKACVVLSRHQAWLTDAKGRIIYGPVMATGGDSAYPTPTGTFHVLSKDAHYRSTEFHNAPMPYSVFFYPGDAFHADNVNKWSHGCIHLNWDDAKAFFNALKVRDQVQILP